MGDATRVPRVRLESVRVDNLAEERQGRVVKERIAHHRARIRDHDHVAVVDRLEAAHRRAIEAEPIDEHASIDLIDRQGQMVQRSEQVDELHIDELDVVLLCEEEYVPRRRRSISWHGSA